MLMYFIMDIYLKTNIIIANINAVVEKFDGKINISVINTGSHNSFKDWTKSIGSSLVLDK
jgi:hypothetical protein